MYHLGMYFVLLRASIAKMSSWKYIRLGNMSIVQWLNYNIDYLHMLDIGV